MIKETQTYRRAEAISELGNMLAESTNEFQERRATARIFTEVGGLLNQKTENVAENAYLAATHLNSLDIRNPQIKEVLLGVLKFLSIPKFQNEGSPSVYRLCEKHERMEILPVMSTTNDPILGDIQEFWQEIIENTGSVETHDNYLIPSLDKDTKIARLQGIFTLFKHSEIKLISDRPFRYVRDNEQAKALLSYLCKNIATKEDVLQVFPKSKQITDYLRSNGIIKLVTGDNDQDYWLTTSSSIPIIARLNLLPDPEEN